MRLPGIRFVVATCGVFLFTIALMGSGLPAWAQANRWEVALKAADTPLPRSARLRRPQPVAPENAKTAAAPTPGSHAALLADIGQGVTDVLGKQPEAGATRLAGVLDRAGQLTEVVVYYEGLGWFLADQPAKAREVLARLAARPRDAFLGRDALYLSLQCAARQGDARATLEMAETWMTNPDPRLAPWVWLRAAVAAKTLGDHAKSQQYLRHLSLFAPWTRAAKAGDALARSVCTAERSGSRATAAKQNPPGDAAAGTTQTDQIGASPCYDPDMPGNVLLRAEALVEKGYAKGAQALLAGVTTTDPGQRARAEYIQGKALYTERRTIAARKAFAQAAAVEPDSALAPWALYHEARCLWRSLDPEDAGRMEALLRQVLASPMRDDRLREAAARHLALLHIEQGRFPEALAAAKQLAGLAVSPDLAAQGLKLTALLHFVTGDFAQAEKELATFDTRFPRQSWVHGARYWRSRTLLILKQTDKARVLLTSLAQGRPNTYYGARAAALLARFPKADGQASAVSPSAVPPRCPGTPQPPDPAVSAVLATADDLKQAHLPRLAEMLLRFASRQDPTRVDLAMAHIAAAEAIGRRRSILRTAWRTFGGCLLRGSAADLAPLRDVLYPQSHLGQIRRALAGTTIHPNLISALIRQESFFDPRAVSAAGAVGLMQLLPDTARAVGNRLGMRVKRADLFDPESNIRLGTAYFLERLRSWGNLVAALASYNAGSGRVKVWNRALAPLGEELFIELIPYTETRNYLRRILTSATMYARLYAPTQEQQKQPRQGQKTPPAAGKK